MKRLKFDFNNLLSNNVGRQHGASEAEIRGLAKKSASAHRHLSRVLADKQDRVRLGLEWYNLPYQAKTEIKVVKRLADEIRSVADNVLFLGIGGSYLGLVAAQNALCPAYYNEFAALRKTRPKVYFEGNNLDPDTLSALLANLNPRRTFVVVISKSGETTETKAAFAVVEEWLKRANGKNYGRKILAVTGQYKGGLRVYADRKNAGDKLSFRTLPLLEGVGGRFSELNIGLLHMAVTGMDIDGVLAGSRAMAERCKGADTRKNPAYLYAVLMHILYSRKSKFISILMPFCEPLKYTADWYCQLFAESLGKKYARKISRAAAGEVWLPDAKRIINSGMTPVSCRGTNDLHSIQQNNAEGRNDKVVTFIKVEKFRSELKVPGKGDFLSGRAYTQLMNTAWEATEWALTRERRPNATVIMPELDAYHWGELIFFFEMAVAFSGELLGINAFDQPGVEGYKNYMYYKLNKPGISPNIAEQIRRHRLIKDKKFIL